MKSESENTRIFKYSQLNEDQKQIINWLTHPSNFIVYRRFQFAMSGQKFLACKKIAERIAEALIFTYRNPQNSQINDSPKYSRDQWKKFSEVIGISEEQIVEKLKTQVNNEFFWEYAREVVCQTLLVNLEEKALVTYFKEILFAEIYPFFRAKLLKGEIDFCNLPIAEYLEKHASLTLESFLYTAKLYHQEKFRQELGDIESYNFDKLYEALEKTVKEPPFDYTKTINYAVFFLNVMFACAWVAQYLDIQYAFILLPLFFLYYIYRFGETYISDHELPKYIEKLDRRASDFRSKIVNTDLTKNKVIVIEQPTESGEIEKIQVAVLDPYSNFNAMSVEESQPAKKTRTKKAKPISKKNVDLKKEVSTTTGKANRPIRFDCDEIKGIELIYYGQDNPNNTIYPQNRNDIKEPTIFSFFNENAVKRQKNQNEITEDKIKAFKSIVETGNIGKKGSCIKSMKSEDSFFRPNTLKPNAELKKSHSKLHTSGDDRVLGWELPQKDSDRRLIIYDTYYKHAH